MPSSSKFLAALLAITPAIVALPTGGPLPPSPNPAPMFQMLVSSDNPTLDVAYVNANSGILWIGRSAEPDCTNVVDCPAITSYTGGGDTLGLNVAVPGGQRVYIDSATQLLKYTSPHSANVPGTGNGFWLQLDGSSGFFNLVSPTAKDADPNWRACPTYAGSTEYQIYDPAFTAGFDCANVKLRVPVAQPGTEGDGLQVSAPQAWSYP